MAIRQVATVEDARREEADTARTDSGVVAGGGPGQQGVTQPSSMLAGLPARLGKERTQVVASRETPQALISMRRDRGLRPRGRWTDESTTATPSSGGGSISPPSLPPTANGFPLRPDDYNNILAMLARLEGRFDTNQLDQLCRALADVKDSALLAIAVGVYQASEASARHYQAPLVSFLENGEAQEFMKKVIAVEVWPRTESDRINLISRALDAASALLPTLHGAGIAITDDEQLLTAIVARAMGEKHAGRQAHVIMGAMRLGRDPGNLIKVRDRVDLAIRLHARGSSLDDWDGMSSDDRERFFIT